MHNTQQIVRRYFSPAGKIQAEQLVNDMKSRGVQAKIDVTWEDYGAKTQWEMVMVYSEYLKLWYQALSPADVSEMNAGKKPTAYKDILAQAERALKGHVK